MQEVMANAAVISDEQVTDCSGAPASSSKPGNAGYATEVPVNNDKTARKDKPCLKVDLTNEESKEPKEVGKIVVQGNVGRVSVEVKKAGSDKPVVLLENVPVSEKGIVSLPSVSKLEEIKVIFEEPRSNEPDYKAILSVFACGHFPEPPPRTTVVPVTTPSLSE